MSALTLAATPPADGFPASPFTTKGALAYAAVCPHPLPQAGFLIELFGNFSFRKPNGLDKFRLKDLGDNQSGWRTSPLSFTAEEAFRVNSSINLA
jgi:hypothetical protein